MLWNLTLGHPLFRAKLAREKALFDRMAETAAFQEYILQRWEETDNSPVFERTYDRTDAEFLALDDEFAKVAERSAGRWEDVVWLFRNAVSRSGLRRWLAKMRLVWVFLAIPWRFIRYTVSAPSTASVLAGIEQTEADWTEERRGSLQFIEESEALGWYTPEEAAAQRQRLFEKTQGVHETLRKAKEACWLIE